MAIVALDSLERAIEGLDEEDFFKREEASERVERWIGEGQIDENGYALLFRTLRTSPSFEVKHRLGKLLEKAPLRIVPRDHFIQIAIEKWNTLAPADLGGAFAARADKEIIATKLVDMIHTRPDATGFLGLVIHHPETFGVDAAFTRRIYDRAKTLAESSPTVQAFVNDVATLFPEPPSPPKGPTKWDLF